MYVCNCRHSILHFACNDSKSWLFTKKSKKHLKGTYLITVNLVEVCGQGWLTASFIEWAKVA